MKIKKQEVTVVSSLDVTKTFGKLHKDVMESIRGIESNISRAEFSALLYKLYLQDFVWNERQAIKRKIRNQQKRKFAWLFFRRRIKIHPIYGKSCKWFGWLRLGLWQGKSIYWKYKYKAPANSVTYAYKNDKMHILLLSTCVIMCLTRLGVQSITAHKNPRDCGSWVLLLLLQK